MSKSKTVKLGKVNIPAEDFKDQNVRASISIRVPMGMLKAYKREAEKRGIGYQTLMLEVLQNHVSAVDLEKLIDERIQKALKRA
jgi:predicted DNA binding CopG/RHH family protein